MVRAMEMEDEMWKGSDRMEAERNEKYQRLS